MNYISSYYFSQNHLIHIFPFSRSFFFKLNSTRIFTGVQSVEILRTELTQSGKKKKITKCCKYVFFLFLFSIWRRDARNSHELLQVGKHKINALCENVFFSLFISIPDIFKINKREKEETSNPDRHPLAVKFRRLPRINWRRDRHEALLADHRLISCSSRSR
jgi:hypothetical protein